MYAVEVYFLGEDDKIHNGELINPYWIADRFGSLDVEYVGDNEVDVYRWRNNGEEQISRVHISRVSSMRVVSVA